MIALRRTLAVAGAATLAVALTPVASAQAPPRPPAPARFVAPTPAQGSTLAVSNPTVHAFVSSVPGQKLFVTVTGPATVTREVAATSTCQEVRETVPLPLNGSYEVRVTADAPAPAPLPTDESCQGGTPDKPRQFFVAAPPKPPSGVKAAMEGRAVNVSWAKNPEPDIVSYRVQRSVGTGAFQQVGEVPGTSFKDGAAPPGGPLRYRVLAVRRGKTPTETVVSAPSAPVTVGRPGAGRTRGRGGSYSASGSSKSVFSGPPQPGAGGAAAASEEGFDERLPYAGDEEAPRELGAEETSNSSHRSLAFIAGGLLVLAVYMHLWWLKRQAEQPLSA